MAGAGTSLQDKHVVVLGFGRQGKALARWLPQQGATVTVSDMRDMGNLADDILDFLDSPVSFALGGHPLELLDETDILCLSGGVPLEIPIVQVALARNIPVTNDAILFLERCPALVIGITGSAGKTTTTSLVGKMAEAHGRKTWVGGNIGNVLLDNLEEMKEGDLVVMELSSFQLELSTISPDISAILNITPNHLDRHKHMHRYIAAKSNVFQHQAGSDMVILSADNPITEALGEAAPAKVAYFSARNMTANGAFLLGHRLAIVGECSATGTAQVVCDKEEIKLRGEHNLSNVLAACAIAGAAGISVDAIRKAILEFRGVEHRLEIVAEIDSVTWINDSIATAPERVIAALRSFEEPTILLTGGRDKDLPWAEMAGTAVERCKAVIAFGEHGRTIAQSVHYARRGKLKGRLERIEVVRTLEEAVRMAEGLASPGDVVLLSPGGTSFDAYTDFAERGDHFRELVSNIKKQRR